MATIVTDSFTRADSTTSMGTADTGQAWSAANGVWGISGNRAYLVSETHTPEDLGAYAVVEVGSDTHVASAKMFNVLAAGSYPGIVARFESVNNFYLAYYEQASGGSLVLYWRNGATWVSLNSVAQGWAEGAEMGLSVAEEAGQCRLRLYINGVEKLNAIHNTAGRPRGTKAGLRDDFDAGVTTGATFDDFTVTSPNVVKNDPVGITDSVTAVRTQPGQVTKNDNVAITDIASVTLEKERRRWQAPDTVSSNVLGVGKHTVYLYDRGGRNRIGQIVKTEEIRYARQRDEMTEATIIVKPDSQNVPLRPGSIGRHEIVIYRSTAFTKPERVWEGPITLITWKGSRIEVKAKDVLHYCNRTIMRNAYDNRYSADASKVAPVTTRMEVILAHEMARKEAQDPPINVLPHLVVYTNSATARTSRFTPPYYSSVWEEMDYMAAKSGLDYCTVGRSIVLFDVHEVIGRTATLSDHHFQDDLIITGYGMELATVSAVTDGEGRWASVGQADDYYGEVELVHTLYGEGVDFEDPDNPTQAELDALQQEMYSQAQRNAAGRYPVPIVVRVPDGTALNPSVPIPFSMLVPGIRIPIRSSRLEIELEQEQKLDKVDVREDESGETISVTLSPSPGATPWGDDTSTGADEEDA